MTSISTKILWKNSSISVGLANNSETEVPRSCKSSFSILTKIVSSFIRSISIIFTSLTLHLKIHSLFFKNSTIVTNFHRM